MGTERESRYLFRSRKKNFLARGAWLLFIFVLLMTLSRLGLLAPGGDLVDQVTKILLLVS